MIKNHYAANLYTVYLIFDGFHYILQAIIMPKSRLQTKNSFNLNLTPLLKNSLKLLSMPHIELLSEINRALENNITLVEKESKSSNNKHFDGKKTQEEQQLQIESKLSLFDALLDQLSYTGFNKQQLTIAQIIIENITESGFLEVNIDFVARAHNRNHPDNKVSRQSCETVRNFIQNNFEPLGISAFNTQEFLSLQIKKQKNSEHSTLFIKLLAEKIDINKINSTQKDAFLSTIKKLPKTPVDNFKNDTQTQYIQADADIEKNELGWHITLKVLPNIAINKEYLALRPQIKDKILFNQHLLAARGLINFIEYRQQQLQLIIETLITKQEKALIKGIKHLLPLSQKELAFELNIGESTLSRLLKNKYIDTPIGVIRIQELFSAKIDNYASKSIQQKIVMIIQKENKPLSDQKIVHLLNQDNINISRRTVTKYRKALNIPCARYRKLSQ